MLKKFDLNLDFFYCQRDFNNTKCMSSQTKNEK